MCKKDGMLAGLGSPLGKERTRYCLLPSYDCCVLSRLAAASSSVSMERFEMIPLVSTSGIEVPSLEVTIMSNLVTVDLSSPEVLGS